MQSAWLKFKILHIFTHLLSIVGLVWVFQSGQYYWLAVAFLFYLYAGIIGVNVALHRFFSHRSFQVSKVGYWFLLFSSFFPMLGSPAAWGTVHRFHHTHSDQANDPHSPKTAGRLASWFTIWPKIDIPLSLYRSFVADKNIRWLDNNYFRLVIGYILILGLIDIRLVCFAFALPAVGCFHGASAIAVLPHLSNFPGSYRNHTTTDNSHNCFFAWVLSLGEGWHNNHHNSPQNYRHGEKWWEFDPPAFFIKYFFKTNL